MTPSHDGSMTPRTGAWDPAITNTPSRSTTDYDYLEDPSPSPSYNPNTPGYSMNTPFAPHTPGNYQGNIHEQKKTCFILMNYLNKEFITVYRHSENIAFNRYDKS